jgi:hypothetical protein
MKPNPKSSFLLFSLLPAAVLAFAVPMKSARGAAAVEAVPEYSEVQKASLKALDGELARFDAMLEEDTDIQHKATVKAFLDAFKDRREEMNKEPFDQGKYDEIRFDINVEYQRLAMWLAPPITPPLASKAAGISEIVVYKLSPSPANRADVRAALAAADREIARLESHAGSPAEKSRIQGIKARRAELRKDFTKARWDGLLAEMKGEIP